MTFDPSILRLRRNDVKGALRLRTKRIAKGAWSAEDDRMLIRLQDNPKTLLFAMYESPVKKALPKKSIERSVKKAPNNKASSKNAGATGKTRYNYPQDKKTVTDEKPKADPVKVPPETSSSTQHKADPQELANQLQMPVNTIKHIALRFKTKPAMGGRSGFVSFMKTRLKKVVDKHQLDGDYFGLIYDALVHAH